MQNINERLSGVCPILPTPFCEDDTIDCGSLERALEVLHRLSVARDAGTLDVDELVPAAQTVLVRGGEARGPRGFADRLSALIEGAGTEGGLADPMPETVIPVLPARN